MYRRLASTKTLVRAGVAALSLGWAGAALAQGATAMDKPPAYGAAWAAAHARLKNLDAEYVAPDSAKAARLEAPRTTDGNARTPGNRNGG
jgi:hypothetical protein